MWTTKNLAQIELTLKVVSKSQTFFSGRGFSQKTIENTSHTSKNKFIGSFFWENPRPEKNVTRFTDL